MKEEGKNTDGLHGIPHNAVNPAIRSIPKAASTFVLGPFLFISGDKIRIGDKKASESPRPLPPAVSQP